ncbi:lysophospholipid acyltransferase family protein [Nitrogeniibacter mangrovi]|uniref:Lysophospholipid acyltransferase family protein n=1 Tax=Nitrogeniibacter mangrovi TaxID=2016596 RepID=A0A6C1AZ31_9RHOO|nr:lysophospholipid acyltransferase family protein [Nitrogeniibacter mangrovi]QID16612.1 lysophospholipid acyltransferase family protein [Nitrogeniibacter mangrovi]
MLTLVIARLIAALPLAWVHRLGALLGWIVYASSPKYRERLKGNLALALGEAAERVRPGAIAEAGKQSLELPWILLRTHEEVVAKVVRVSGWAQVEAAEAAGEGILFLTPHLGCFEITAQHFADHAPVTVLYRPPNFEALVPLIEAGRQRALMAIAPANVTGVRKLIRALRQHQAIGILPDQTPDEGEGIWSPFFGRQAWTMTLAARMSEVSHVRVLSIWAERLPRGEGYHVHITAPREAIEGDTEARVHAINREMEHLIRACPAQYLWGYHRYRRPRGVPPRPEDAA